MKDNLKELRELIFKCEEVKKDVLRITKEKEVLQNLANYYHEVGHSEALRAINMACDELDNEIGRDITLEDVLRAIEIKKPTIKISNIDSLNYGKIADITDEEKIGIMEMWKLGKPLQEQSEECIDNLIKLLK